MSPTSNSREMTLDEFRQSLAATEPPAGLTHALAGLWWDAKGDWKRAHESAQQDEGVEGSWVHAYLHRKEGDQDNAAYWYSDAPTVSHKLDDHASASERLTRARWPLDRKYRRLTGKRLH
jgi:hypothetical protein